MLKLDNEVVNEIEKLKANEKDARWVQDTLTQVEKTIQRGLKRRLRLSSTKYGLLLQLKLLPMNISTTILGQDSKLIL
jgi:hypothetical protein